MNPVPRTMVISLQKAGTHLVQELMLELGYRMVGVARPEPRNAPRLDDAQRRAVAALVLDKPDYDALLELSGTEEFIERTDEAWAALGWHWQRRLGQPVVNRYGQTRFAFTDRLITNPYLPYSRFADTPAGLCWILHELNLDRVDGSFVNEWVATGAPPLIFNYRDPRDTVVSMINFLAGRTREGYGSFFEGDIFSAILASKSSWEEKIDYALRDPAFLGQDQFEASLWLFNHPAVCKVRYEDLVGSRGGGSRQRQIETVARLLAHIGSNRDPEAVADHVYNPASWTFFRGRTGAWRERFTERNLAQFNERFGDLLEHYGYE